MTKSSTASLSCRDVKKQYKDGYGMNKGFHHYKDYKMMYSRSSLAGKLKIMKHDKMLPIHNKSVTKTLKIVLACFLYSVIPMQC